MKYHHPQAHLHSPRGERRSGLLMNLRWIKLVLWSQNVLEQCLLARKSPRMKNWLRDGIAVSTSTPHPALLLVIRKEETDGEKAVVLRLTPPSMLRYLVESLTGMQGRPLPAQPLQVMPRILTLAAFTTRIFPTSPLPRHLLRFSNF